MLHRLIPFALVLAIAAPDSLAAQEGEERRQMLTITTWEVDPADAPAFEAAVNQIVEAARMSNIGSDNRWSFLQNGSQYMLVSPIDNFADLDDTDQFMRAFEGTPGEAQMQEAMGKFPSMNFQTVSEEIVEQLPGWSYANEEFDYSTMRFAHMDVFWPKSGMGEAFGELNAEWVQFFKDLNYPYPYDAHEVHFGDSGRYVYVTFVDDLGRYHGENSLMKLVEMKNMGERWQAISGKFGETVARWAHYDMVYRPDMTYWP